MQSFMASSLGVLPDRGVIKFVGIAEEFLAIGGTTILGQIERLQKAAGEEKKPDMSTRSAMKKKQSRKSLHINTPAEAPIALRSQSTPASRMPSPVMGSPPMPAMPTEKTALDRRAEKVQKLGKRKSFMAMFGR